VASDGLWDICEDQQAIDLVKNCKNTLEISKTLVQYSLKNGSKDNISVLTLKF
jgi:protein phosphatase PTC1